MLENNYCTWRTFNHNLEVVPEMLDLRQEDVQFVVIRGCPTRDGSELMFAVIAESGGPLSAGRSP